MNNIKLTIEYDGSRYHGWQVQPNAMTVQQKIEEAIHNLTGEKIKIVGASRTDSGVHAYGQVANFVTNSNIRPDKFCDALNHFLPCDIVIAKSECVSCEFHSRYDSKGKKYRYVIYNRSIPSAIWRSRAYHVKHMINLDIMRKEAKVLIGEHDFSSFRSSDKDVKTSVRTIYDIDIQKNGDFIIMDISGNGFLYNMVRIIVGTLVDMTTRKIYPYDMLEILQAKDRKKAGNTAPPCGLYLMEVWY